MRTAMRTIRDTAHLLLVAFLCSTVTFMPVAQAQTNSRVNSITVDNWSSMRIANNFVAGDPGAQINAADASLGATVGDIWIFGGGTLTTQATISTGHHLRMFNGTYTNGISTDRTPMFRMQDNTSLSCSARNSCTVKESASGAIGNQNLVCNYSAGVNCTTLSGTAANIHVWGIHFLGNNAAGSSLIDTVSLGNCVGCSVKDSWFDGIKSSHVLLGGTSGSGNWGDRFEVSGNFFSGEQNCSVCIINTQNFNIHDNVWYAHGNGAAAAIDVEPNSTTDHTQQGDIHDNLFDESAAIQTVYCVTIQNGPFVAMGIIKVHDNICSGGAFTAFGTNKLQQCYTIGPGPVNTFNDMEIYNNVCRVTLGGGGIGLVGVNRATVHDNILDCINGNAIELSGSVTNSSIERNKVNTVSSCSQNAKGQFLSASIAETGASNANNIFRDNIAKQVVVIGTGSKVVTSTLIDGSGQSFHVPVGLNAGVQGGVQLNALGVPTLSQTFGLVSTGSCVLAGTTYFYKVRAVSASGGLGVPSNEITFNAGGGFGCQGILWTKATGAKSYNIYRSTTTGTEQLIDNVATGATYYDDFGGQTPTTAIDSNDSSVSIVGPESTAPAGIASSDIMWPDSASHCWKVINNNGTASCVAGLALAQTWTGTQTFSSVASMASSTANPASAGFLRLAPADSIKFRNNANGADLNALSETADVLQVGEATNGINVPGPAVMTAVTASGQVAAASVALGGDAFTVTPRFAWGAFLPGNLTTTWTAAQFTPKKGITVLQVELAAKTAPVGCGTNAVIRVTDGTSNQDTTLTAGQVTNNIAGGQAYAANAVIQVKVLTAAAACGTNPADVNVTVQYKMQ